VTHPDDAPLRDPILTCAHEIPGGLMTAAGGGYRYANDTVDALSERTEPFQAFLLAGFVGAPW